jgi:CASK-interacting protein
MGSIHEAAVAGNIEILKLLIDNGANVNLKDNKGLRPLHYAAWQGRSEPVFILLRRGANVNEQSINGDTPLHLACQYGHNDIVQLLLFHQADPTLVNRRLLTPLDLACENGRFHVVNSLVQNSLCQRMIVNTTEPNAALHLAAKNGHTDIVRLLLLNGMDINRMTINDGTALHVACRNGRYETAKLLLECGIDINLCNSYEQIAYEVVIKQKTGNDIKRLIKGRNHICRYQMRNYCRIVFFIEEFSDAILVRAIRSYTDNHVGALNFAEGDCITVRMIKKR